MARAAPRRWPRSSSELDDAVIIGPKTNLAFLRALLRSPGVRGRDDRHRLHRRQSRPARRCSRIRRTREPSTPPHGFCSSGATRAGPRRSPRSTRGGSPIRSNSSALAASASTSPSTESRRGCISSRAPMWIPSPTETTAAGRRRDHALRDGWRRVRLRRRAADVRRARRPFRHGRGRARRTATPRSARR